MWRILSYRGEMMRTHGCDGSGAGGAGGAGGGSLGGGFATGFVAAFRSLFPYLIQLSSVHGRK